MTPLQDRPPDRAHYDKSSDAPQRVEAAEEQSWFHPTDEDVANFGTPSPELVVKIDRIFQYQPHRLILRARVDSRGIGRRPGHGAPRPRERRPSHGRRRRAQTSRDDGSGSDEPAPGRRTVYTYGIHAWWLA